MLGNMIENQESGKLAMEIIDHPIIEVILREVQHSSMVLLP